MTKNSPPGSQNPRSLREIQDEFFGIEDALQEGKIEGEIREDQNIIRLQSQVKGDVESIGSNDPEQLIDSLQAKGRLPESLYTPQLITLLKFLGQKMGIAFKIFDPETSGEYDLFPLNRTPVGITVDNLKDFLTRGALAGAAILPLAMSSIACQPLGPYEAVNWSGNVGYNWEVIVILLLLLGVTAASAVAIARRKKTDVEKQANNAFDEYQHIKKDKDPEKKKKAKEKVISITMGELPTEADKAAQNVEDIDPDELNKALKIKKKVDDALAEAEKAIAKNMLLPEKKNLEAINNKKDKVLALLDAYLLKLEALYAELSKQYALELEKAAKKELKTTFLIEQILLEKKKIRFMIDYLKLMRMKWLVFIQNIKNQLMQGVSAESLSASDKLMREIFKGKEELDNLLDQQKNLTPADFQKKLKELEKELDEKIKKASAMGAGEITEETEKQIGYDHLKLLNGGDYSHATGIGYLVNGKQKHIPLLKDVTVQIWVDPNKDIKINYNLKGSLIETTDLAIKNGELVLKETGQSLADYIKEKEKTKEQDEAGIKASAELGPEAEPVLNSIAELVISIGKQIKDNSYEHFGDEIYVDDDAIDYHLVRVHREFIKGKAQTVVRLTLGQNYWKNALSGLHNQKDIPSHTVNFNYSSKSGGQVTVSQPMLRFNVVSNGKQASVLVPRENVHTALNGEIRIIFDPGTDYSTEDIKAVVAEAVKRLGIAGHIKPVSEGSRKKLQDRLREIRKESVSAAGATKPVHSEYSAELVKPASVEELRKKGLHSVYTQFSGDHLESMFKMGKLLCTSTRWAKGVLTHGMSSTPDMESGGATEVFTRILTNHATQGGYWYNSGKPALVFRPEIMSRLDCYCYASDQYGSKKPGTFSQRISPAKLVEQMSVSYNTSNEVMFHDAISIDDAAYLVCDDPATYIARLKKIGITSVGGKPLSEFVISKAKFKSLKQI